MQTSTSKFTSMPTSPWITINSFPWLMLISRSILFHFFQLLIALVLATAGTQSAWDESASYTR